MDVGLGAGGLAAGAILPGGGYGKLLKGGRKYLGRRGSKETRDQLDKVRDEILDNNPNLKQIGGGRDRFSGDDIAEEYLRPINGGKKGGSYPDLTFQSPDGSKFRINTVDTYKKNNTPTNRELDNAYRIFEQTNEPIFLIPKSK